MRHLISAMLAIVGAFLMVAAVAYAVQRREGIGS